MLPFMPFQELSIDEYRSQFEGHQDFQLIDVREVDEFAEARVPGAVNIPLSEFQLRVHELRNDQPIVLICARGGRSAMAAEFLASLGYEDLYNFSVGTVGWLMRGLPAESS